MVAASAEGSRTKEEEAVLSGNQLRCSPRYLMMMPCSVVSVYVLIDPFSKRRAGIPASSVQPTLFSLQMSASGRQAQTSSHLGQSDRQPCLGDARSRAEVCAQLNLSPLSKGFCQALPSDVFGFAPLCVCRVTGVQTVPVKRRRARCRFLSHLPAARP